MNTPSPLVPQGTFADKGKSHIRLTFFAILAIHMVFLGLLLIAGCNKKPADQAQDAGGIPPVPPAEPWPSPGSTSAGPANPTAQDGTLPPPVGGAGGLLAPPTPGAGVGVGPGAGTPIGLPPTPLTPGIAPVSPDAGPVGSLVEHTIAKGESFYTLGKKYGVGFKSIAEANPGVNPTRLKIGDKVRIPPSKSGTAAAPSGGAPVVAEAGGVKTYKVKSGDNLSKIASAHGIKPKELRAFNNLKTDQIKVGQTLKIPVKAAPAPAEAAAPPPATPPPALPGSFPPPPPAASGLPR